MAGSSETKSKLKRKRGTAAAPQEVTSDAGAACAVMTGTPAESWPLAPTSASAPLFVDNVLPFAARQVDMGERVALITIVGIEGSGPRPLGAQMAVAANGEAVGYLSGGCLEAALIEEAQGLIQARRNRIVRYGRGSPYLDIRLPCGSGIDVHFDTLIAPDLIREAARRSERREPFALVSDLAAGTTRIETPPPAEAQGLILACQREGDTFVRPYLPAIRLLVAGTGPASAALAALARPAGIAAELITPEPTLRAQAEGLGIAAHALDRPALPASVGTDAWTAAALIFHEHMWEVPLLQALLASNCFYVGAQGSLRVHKERMAALKAAGVGEDLARRLRAPIGLIPSAKSPLEIAVGVLAEVMAEARRLRLVL